MQRFKNRHIIAHLCQIAGTSQTGRTRTDNGHLVILLLGCRLRLDVILPCPVSRKTLQFTNGNRLALDTANTFSFALALLRTYTAADCRKGACFADYLIGLLKISLFNLRNKSRDIYGDRTSFDTLCIFTIKASLCLFHRFFFIITKAHFLEIRRAHLGLLFSYRYFLHHIHYLSPPQCPHPPWWVSPS